MSFDAHTSNAALRRTRSTGDIPRQPEATYRPPGSRHSDSHSDLCDWHQPGQGQRAVASSSLSATSARIIAASRSNTMPPFAGYPERAQTQTMQTVDGELRPLPPLRLSEPPGLGEVTQPPHREMSSYERTLAFFGLGRRASRARRSIVGLFFNLTSGFLQV